MSGLYLHIPYCRKRCTYCDFHFSTTFDSYRAQLQSALVRELEIRAQSHQMLIQTIYFGGGTPSLLNEAELAQLFKTIRRHYIVADACEITFEVNPEDINEQQLTMWKAVGINRLSIGLQTFSNENLSWMNRAHNVQDGLHGVALAQKMGFDNISVDLIYGLPQQSLTDWSAALAQVFNLNIQHLSAYCLTVEPKTALQHLVQKKQLQPADENLQSEQFLALLDFAKKAGFVHYEISNFAKPGFHSQHNSAYWRFEPYIGIGPSAHSFNGQARRWNIANNSAYIKGVGHNEDWYQTETLTAKERRNEQILLGLRTIWGLDLSKFEANWTQKESAQIEEFARLNWLLINKESMVLTEIGKLHADGIAAALFRVD